MHTFLDNFHQGGKYSAQIASHQAELKREEKITDQKSLNISSLQTDYLNLDSSSGFGSNNERVHDVHTKCTFCGGVNHSAEKCFKRIRKEKDKSRAFDVTSNRQMERMPRKCFGGGSYYHMIAKCPKPQKVMKNGKSNYFLIKKVIVHATTAKIIVTKRYMHLWQVCLAMTNVQVKIMVTFSN